MCVIKVLYHILLLLTLVIKCTKFSWQHHVEASVDTVFLYLSFQRSKQKPIVIKALGLKVSTALYYSKSSRIKPQVHKPVHLPARVYSMFFMTAAKRDGDMLTQDIQS